MVVAVVLVWDVVVVVVDVVTVVVVVDAHESQKTGQTCFNRGPKLGCSQKN